ncbi:MAG: diphthine synthase, partial [Candidatus Ranarchaeia archaeon]
MIFESIELVKKMGRLRFIGLGLGGIDGFSQKGLTYSRAAYKVFVDGYTNFLEETMKNDLESILDKEVIILKRKDVEQNAETAILSHTENGDVVFLIPGDPMISTTHVDLRLRAHKKGIKTSIIHGASIQTAAFSVVGLENYKGGRSVTIPFPQEEKPSVISPIEKICENVDRGLHTLVYLDVKREENRFMTIHEGIKIILEMAQISHTDCISSDTLMIGVARVGFSDLRVKANQAKDLLLEDFGKPPHVLIIPGKL